MKYNNISTVTHNVFIINSDYSMRTHQNIISDACKAVESGSSVSHTHCKD